jgi:hypothetical protein
MSHGTPESNGQTTPRPLPPVEAPNVRLIIQLFFVPGLLVAVVIGFILLFFGSLGVGPQTPDEFIKGLNNASELKRWKTAQDLAQVLPRKADLRADAKFALGIAEMLERELRRPPPPPSAMDQDAPDLLEYLPAVSASFVAPVGVGLLAEMIDQYQDRLADAEARRRFRNAIVALGIQGAKLREYDRLSPEARERLDQELRAEAGDKPGRAAWAKAALAALQERTERGSSKSPLGDSLGAVAVLAKAVRAPDEMSRKYAVLALANWDVEGVEVLLRQTAADPCDDLQYLEDNDKERARREIQVNAALALARRGSKLTPWSQVLAILDESALAKLYPNQPPGAMASFQLKALADLYEFRHNHPEAFAQQAEVIAAVEKLRSNSSMAVQVAASRLLGTDVSKASDIPSVSRQLLIMAGVALGVCVFLAVAVFARWRRQPVPEVLTPLDS